MADIVGDNFANTLNGTVNADTISGLGGNDTINAGSGDDTVYGGDDNDIINGEDGDDYLDGGAGNDTINGGIGADEIITGTGDDIVDGGTGADFITVGSSLNAADQINGGTGPGEIDILSISGTYASYVVFGATTVTNIEQFQIGTGQIRLTLNAATNVSVINAAGQAQTDFLYLNGTAATNNMSITGGAGADIITGGSGNDTITGGNGQDTLVGGAGNDQIIGGLDADTLTGGTGADIFTLTYNTPRSDSSPSTIDVITDFEGAGVVGGDKIDLPSYAYGRGIAFNASPINFTFVVGGGASGVQLPSNLVGDGFADVSWKYDSTNNRVELWVDVDDNGQFSELDIYTYINGINILTQEDFTDTFPIWRGTVGDDNLLASAGNIIAYGLGGNDTMRGGDGNDQLYGGDGADVLRGGNDNDTIYGEVGNDTIFGDAGNDALYGGTGDDVITGGAGGDSIYGEEGNDTLTAGTSSSGVYGGIGNDTIYGGLGDDTLYGEAGIDTIDGGSGNDNIDGGADDDTVSGGIGNDTVRGGTGNDTVNGNDGNDDIAGNAGINILNGGAGDDLVYLASDANARDTVTGGTGADTFRIGNSYQTFGSLAAPHVITDFNRAENDKLQLYVDYYSNGTYGFTSTPLVFRGELAASQYFDGAALPGGDLGTGFTQVWWSRIGTGGTAKTVLIMDIDRDLTLTSADFVVEFAPGTIADVQLTDFVGNPFRAYAGTSGNDTYTGNADANLIYGLLGNDTLSGAAGNDSIYGGGGDDTLNGDDGNDQLYGGDGADVLRGGNDGDTIYGEVGNDTIFGDAGNDALYGGTGDDVITGGAGGDSIYGEEGNDTLTAGTSSSGVYGGIGNDTIYGGLGDDTLYGEAGIDTIDGGSGNDNIDGGADDDTVSGGIGNDTVRGGTGNDTVNGNDGNDDIAGNAGINILNGGAGDDLVYLASDANARDTVTGGTGADTFRIGNSYQTFGSLAAPHVITDFNRAENDKLQLYVDYYSNGTYGFTSTPLVFRGELAASQYFDGAALPGGDLGTGFTQVWWSRIGTGGTAKTVLIMDIDRDLTLTSADLVVEFAPGTIADVQLTDFVGSTFRSEVGTPQANVYFGSDSANIYYGVDGDDTITGNGGNDQLYGGNGADTISGGQGNDTIYGGAGNDTITSDVGTDTIYGEAGNDTIQGGDDADTIFGGADDDNLQGQFGADTLYGESGNDTISGGADNDYIGAGEGNDTVNGDDGNDTIYGEGGTDILKGGAGLDGLYGGEADDILDGGEGNDYLEGGNGRDIADYSTGTVGITINLSDASNVYALGGNMGTDTLVNIEGVIGTAFNDTLTGTVNDNVFEGGLGDDVMDALAGLDTLSYARATAGVTISLAITAAQNTGGAGTDTVANFENLTGSAFADNLTGSAVNNLILAGAGADVVLAGDGADEVRGGTGADTLSGEGGDDIIYGEDDNDTINGGLGLDVLYGGAGNDTIRGNENDDKLYGEAGIDTLDGGDGNDQLLGGEGDDQLTGGLGDDTLVGGLGSDEASYRGLSAGVTVDLSITTAQNTGGGGIDTLSEIENVAGTTFNDVFTGTSGNNRFLGGAGVDTVRYSNAAAGVTVDLAITTVQNTIGAGSDSFSLIENLVGSSFNDTLLGDSAGNTLEGGAGNDTLDGRTGIDTASYAAAAAGVTVDLSLTTAQNTGGAGTDTLANFENVTGSAFNDTLGGTSGANVLDGGVGIDTASYASSTAGVTVSLAIIGAQNTVGAGTDTLISIENLTGSGFADTFAGTSGANVFDGGAGVDTVSYLASTAGVTASLALAGAQNTIGAGSDTFISIENLVGSGFADVLTGDAGANRFEGGGGDDQLTGGLGDDTLIGGAGVDEASYRGLSAGVTVDLSLTTAQNTGGGGIDTLSEIENIAGTTFNDVFTGTSGNNRFLGGAGVDTVRYANAAAGVAVDLAITVAQNTVGAGSDTFSLIENLVGSSFNDTLLGDNTANALDGGAGINTLTGRGGADVFQFSVLETSANRDIVTDFAAGVDKFGFLRSAFTGFSGAPAGALAAAQFGLGTVATTASQRVLYDQATGNVWYDADGNGAGAQVHIATLTGAPVLGASDFVLI